MARGLFRTLIIDADWLNDSRCRAYARMMALLLCLGALFWILATRDARSPSGEPIGTDFVSFWAASKLALSGQFAAPYDPAAHHAAQVAAMGWDPGYFAFFYPPPYLLLCLPLALLPYGVSLALWLGTTGMAYFTVLRRWAGREPVGIAILAFPALFVNAGHGQNGFITAALAGGGLMLMRSRPWLAGLLLGALVIKPHLAILLPLVLAARGEWRTFLATGASATLMILVSAAVLGIGCWQAFLQDSALARTTLEQGLVDQAKMQSTFAAVRLIGGSVAQAYGAQAMFAGTVAILLVMLARRNAAAMAQNAAFMTAAVMTTPFVLDYDLTWIAFPLVWLFSEARKDSFLPWEKIVMACAFMLPLLGRTIAMKLHLPLAPVVLGALFAIILRRAALAARTSKESDQPLGFHVISRQM